MSIIQVNEIYSYREAIYGDNIVNPANTFVIDTDKVDAEGSDFFSFTQGIIDAARRGETQYRCAVKYSFTTTDWEYNRCRASYGAVPDHTIEVSLY